MKKIFFITIGLSVFLLADFTRDVNGIVTDNTTALQWQDDYSDNGNLIKETLWEDAIGYCEKLVLDGIGWRLPNINELKTIIDDTKNVLTIPSTFTKTDTSTYWSSTTYDATKTIAWTVEFNKGRSFRNNSKTGSHKVRCVREIPIP